MGNMSDAVQSMVDEVRSAKEARSDASRQLREDIGIRLSEIRSDTHNLMERFHREDKEREATTGEMLGEFRQADSERKAAIGEMIGEFRQVDTERRATVDELKANANDMVKDIHQANSELKANSKDMVKDFSQANSELKGNVKEMLGDFNQANSELKAATGEMLGEFASDHRQAHRIWTEGLKGRKRAKAVVKEPKKEPKITETKGGPPNAEKVMEAIVSHPDGIRLIDIGNEVGVDWRTLIGPTKSLVDENRVEKIENMYYPKEKE